MADWSREEVEATVTDYFSMLEEELRGHSVNKTERRNRLLRILSNRPKGAVEFKHQNISAILIEFGLPYIDGYKPRKNYQQLLYDVIADRLPHERALLEAAAIDAAKRVDPPPFDQILQALVDPPRPRAPKARYPARLRERRPLRRLGVNFLAIEAANRALGLSGEVWVLEYERARLCAVGAERRAAQIEHTSQVRGDGDGFDILSFEASGKERLIEVKTTKHGSDTPFFVTRNELVVSQSRESLYHLYRVFSFEKGPCLFFKRGRLDREFNLDPEVFEARIA